MEFDDLNHLDFLGLLPCPLKVPFEELLSSFVEHYHKETGTRLSCLVESNANNQIDFFSRLRGISDVQDLPGIVMAPGFSEFFHRGFMAKFKGSFLSFGPPDTNDLMHGMGLQDPERNYHIPCFNPTVMIVDRTVHRDLPIPTRWSDLLKPEYAGLVALRGHQDGNFCEGTLLTIYREKGKEGVSRLGKAVKAGLHPSQMVKFAGSGKKESPAVSAVPYFFSKTVKTGELVSIVWPEDGAVVNPFVMLVQASKRSRLEAISEFITGAQVGQVFASAYFLSPHPQVKNEVPPKARFNWLGWDFIQNNDLGQLVPDLQRIFLESFGGSKR